MPNWKPVKLHEGYWIIQDDDGYTEYEDHTGYNLMFTTKKDAQAKIQLIKEFEND